MRPYAVRLAPPASKVPSASTSMADLGFEHEQRPIGQLRAVDPGIVEPKRRTNSRHGIAPPREGALRLCQKAHLFAVHPRRYRRRRAVVMNHPCVVDGEVTGVGNTINEHDAQLAEPAIGAAVVYICRAMARAALVRAEIGNSQDDRAVQARVRRWILFLDTPPADIRALPRWRRSRQEPHASHAAHPAREHRGWRRALEPAGHVPTRATVRVH